MQAADLIRIVGRAGGHLAPDGADLVVVATAPLPEALMVKLRIHKGAVIDFLNRPIASVVLLHCPPGVPEAWTQGVADLLARSCPASCPAERWEALREDSYTFLQFWAARALGLGWTALDLFGVHPATPWARFDAMGLVALLNGARVAALSDNEAVIEKPNGARLTFRRRGQVPDEACLIWELET